MESLNNYVCNKCNGTGKKPASYVSLRGTAFGTQCNNCNGTGEVNWIENIFGKQLDKTFEKFDIPLIQHPYPPPIVGANHGQDKIDKPCKTLQEKFKEFTRKVLRKLSF